MEYDTGRLTGESLGRILGWKHFAIRFRMRTKLISSAKLGVITTGPKTWKSRIPTLPIDFENDISI
jgi:hypothetical protein